MEITIPNELRTEYPFHSHFLKLDNDHQLHYVDEGHGEVIVMLHGNPTWSFFYRNLIKDLSKNFRVIVPDHMGCGLSSRDENYDYSLKNHIKNTEKLLEHLKIQNFSLIVHDWGGAIGLGVAVNNPARVKNIVAMNTAAFTSEQIPFRINILRNKVGEMFIRSFNGFAYPATFMAVNKKMPEIIKKGFLLPYNNYKNRIATAKFVLDIPMNKEHPSYKTLKNIEDNLKNVKSNVMLLWGEKDFCFDMNFFQKWKSFFPNAEAISYKSASHYLLEDEYDSISKNISTFMSK